MSRATETQRYVDDELDVCCNFETVGTSYALEFTN